MTTVLIIVGILLVLGGLMYLFMMGGMKGIKEMPINSVDLSKVADGIYKGEFHKGRWHYTVEVEVAKGKIAAIKNLGNQFEELAKLNEGVADNVIAQQKVDLDTYSAATIDSKAFLKAVENALTQSK
ncbi:MAG: hypothetical protein A2Y33_02245 [Spirochaetes bacterium GWF1_51_8]|nr:MAG: hypothetical protein A2Y33_02245 [Spirochaetes bacterium GWF1_51_8]